jgi:hypothetical protein
MTGLVEKIEINCDMGEGFGRWKMVFPSAFHTINKPLIDGNFRDQMMNL